MKTKIEIIEETAAFYNNSKRAKDKTGACVYLTEDGKKCAVGRCMIDPATVSWGVDDNAEVLFRKNSQEILLEEYVGHSNNFWMDLQTFHDYDMFWDKGGLTVRGKEHKEWLLKRYES